MAHEHHRLDDIADRALIEVGMLEHSEGVVRLPCPGGRMASERASRMRACAGVYTYAMAWAVPPSRAVLGFCLHASVLPPSR